MEGERETRREKALQNISCLHLHHCYPLSGEFNLGCVLPLHGRVPRLPRLLDDLVLAEVGPLQVLLEGVPLLLGGP